MERLVHLRHDHLSVMQGDKINVGTADCDGSVRVCFECAASRTIENGAVVNIVVLLRKIYLFG